MFMRVSSFVEVVCRKILQPYGMSRLLLKCREAGVKATFKYVSVVASTCPNFT